MTLKELRIWHWKKVLSARKRADQKRTISKTPTGHYASEAIQADRLANFHLGCVQALNDVLPGTAQQDMEK